MDLERGPVLRCGAQWVVRRGRDRDSGRGVLVKEPRADEVSRPVVVRRIAAEAEFLTGFAHPGLLRPLAPGRAVYSDAACTLATYLAWTGPIPPDHVANVLRQLAAALEQVHSRRFGHGGLGPESILVGPGGEVLLAEFAGTPPGGTPPSPEPGTRTLAPELLDSRLGPWGPASDLYALGFVALELLTGPKFAELFCLAPRANPLAWHADPRKTLGDWRDVLPHAPAPLLDLIAGLIEKDPAARPFRNAGQLRRAMERSGLGSGERLPRFPEAS